MKTLASLVIPAPSKLAPADREKIATYLRDAADLFQKGGNDWDCDVVSFDINDDGDRFFMAQDFNDTPAPEVTTKVTVDA